jgi:hypothetical protein
MCPQINMEKDVEIEDVDALVIATSASSRQEANVTTSIKHASALRDAKAPELAKRGIGFWGTYGGVTDIQALTTLKDLAWWCATPSDYGTTTMSPSAV